MDFETIIYIILTIIFLIVGGLSKSKSPQQGQPKSEPTQPEIDIDDLPDSIKRFLQTTPQAERKEEIEYSYDDSSENYLDSVEGFLDKIENYTDYADSSLDTPLDSVEIEDENLHKSHFDRITERLERQDENKVKFDLKTAIIYQTILERKYS